MALNNIYEKIYKLFEISAIVKYNITGNNTRAYIIIYTEVYYNYLRGNKFLLSAIYSCNCIFDEMPLV